ncbi:MAG: hypothetical protein ACOYON_00580 [Fimbriimonas sp.]
MAFLAAVGLPGVACAQAPDVRFRLDLRIDYRLENQGKSSLRLYDLLGRTSVFALTFRLEPGLNAYVSQRLEALPGTGDVDSFDELYVEDQGIWRAGKQFLPFGSGEIFRDTAMAVRGDTNTVLEAIPLALAICDARSGRATGAVARFGNRTNVSAAVGRNFGAQATSFNIIRLPNEAPGRGRGFRRVYGASHEQQLGPGKIKLEAVFLREGMTDDDLSNDIIDLRYRVFRNPNNGWVVGLSRASAPKRDLLRVEGTMPLDKNVNFVPMVRLRGSSLYDVNLSLRVRF